MIPGVVAYVVETAAKTHDFTRSAYGQVFKTLQTPCTYCEKLSSRQGPRVHRRQLVAR